MKNVLLSTKVKNLFREKSVEFVNFHNIRVNGTNLGCSGFVKKCNKFVWKGTLHVPPSDKSEEELVDKVMRLL